MNKEKLCNYINILYIEKHEGLQNNSYHAKLVFHIVV